MPKHLVLEYDQAFLSTNESNYGFNMFKEDIFNSLEITCLNQDFHNHYNCNISEFLIKCLEGLKQSTNNEYFNKIYASIYFWKNTCNKILPSFMFLLPGILSTDWHINVGFIDYHRDHILHQPLTAYIVKKSFTDKEDSFLLFNRNYVEEVAEGLSKFTLIPFVEKYLLDARLPKDSLWLAKNEVSKQMWKDFFMETAFVAALFHDLGYPTQHLNKENDIAMKLTNPIFQNATNEKTESLFSKYPFLLYVLNGYSDQKNVSKEEEYFCSMIHEIYLRTHGLPGALNFLYLHDGFKKEDAIEHPIQRLSLEWAAAAIAMHDMRKIYWPKGKDEPSVPNLRISADVDPVSAIVTLADTLQEFERPVAKFHKKQSKTDDCVKVRYSSACSSTEVNMENNGCMTITFNMTDLDSYCHKLECIKDDETKLFDPVYGFLNLKAWGVNKVVMEAVYDPPTKGQTT